MSRSLPRLTAAAALALVPLFGIAVSASAATLTVNYACQSSAAGQTGGGTLTQTLDATAPATVKAGGTLSVVLTPAVGTLPTQAGGHTLQSLKDAALTIPIPANSSYVSSSLSGGSGLNSTPTLTKTDNAVVMHVPGPIKGGSTFQLPQLTLNLTAGTSGTITSTLGGTSFNDPGLTFTATVLVVIPVDAPTACYPNPSPTLTTTTIT
ncbi:MAG: cyclase [Kutzneria sp.]|nr:cyclase [Kutzneria sp.]MBV9846066.1 cyclase [Kutzneria sp.]